MASEPEDLPRRGNRIRTAEGDWVVREVMLLGRMPLHYAVRMDCPAGPGGAARLSIVLSRAEYEALVARAGRPQPPADRGSRPGRLGPRR